MAAYLEFHDSMLTAIESVGGDIELTLDGYIHRWDDGDGVWKGTGWNQAIRIVVERTAGSVAFRPVPINVATGSVQSRHACWDNLVPVPTVLSERTIVRLELIDGSALDVTGEGELRRLVQRDSSKICPQICGRSPVSPARLQPLVTR